MNLKSFSLSTVKPSRIADSQDLTLGYELNSLLAEEYQAWYQYWSVYQFLVGKERQSIQEKFLELAKDELDDHANKLLNRLSELNLQCYLSTPDSWKEYARSEFMVPDNVADISQVLSLNLTAEDDAIAHYQEVIKFALDIEDFTTADLLKEILADEEEHKSILFDFINDLTVE